MNVPPHLRSLKPGMAEKLGYYVYLYVAPRDGKGGRTRGQAVTTER